MAQRKTTKRRAQAQEAPRPNITPAPDYGRDPADPTPAPAPTEPEAHRDEPSHEPKLDEIVEEYKARFASGKRTTLPRAQELRRVWGLEVDDARWVERELKQHLPAQPDQHPWSGASNRFPKRITLPLADSAYRELRHAQADDDIDTTVRLRAMVDLWENNTRFRAQVDKHARSARNIR